MSDNIVKQKKPKDLIFFNEAVEYFAKYDNNNLPKSNKNNNYDNFIENRNQLRDLMLTELNSLKQILIHNPEKKLAQLPDELKELFKRFIKTYSICPICGGFNHYSVLKNLFLNEDNRDLINRLIQLMDYKSQKTKFNIGIPCCNCFKHTFE